VTRITLGLERFVLLLGLRRFRRMGYLMAPRERASPPSVGSHDPGSPSQRSLAFGTNQRGRDETALLHALTDALAVLVRSGAQESALRESFVHAMKGLGAEKGVLVQVRQQHPLDVEVLYSTGLNPENEAAFRDLRSSPGMSPSLIRRAIDEGEARLIENSSVLGLDATASLRGRPYSVLCAPVADSLTGGVIAVLYFQNEVRRAFETEDLEWLTAYATALGQALTLHVSGQRRLQELETEWRRVQDAGGPEIIGESEATRQLGETLNSLLPSTTRTDAPAILITGESGTGKELVARYLHHYSPRRSRGPFQAFNCAGLRGDLAESKLFGHVKGSFTGAINDTPGLFRAANNGVLLLDEVGELPLDSQALLLRVLETRTVPPVGDTKTFPVDVQVVLATNRSLEEEVAAKRFREDLYYRVNGLQVELVPLRDPRRIADIRPLLGHYLAKHERALKKKTLGLTRDALRVLLQFSWPGNVRQLSNVCSRLVTPAAPGAWLDLESIHRHCPDVLSGPRNPHPEAYLESEDATYSEAIRAFRKKLILDRLRRHGGSAVEAAASLSISGPTLYRYWQDAKRFP
jgi:transcriptional regulator with GAF, ATPase, and Fis domain